MALTITEAALKEFASNCDGAAIAPALDAACAKQQINTSRRLTHFLGHLYHESRGFTRVTENLDYRAERLMEVWPKRFPTLQRAAAYAHNPPALANLVYGGRYGNTDSEDGWRYRGRGFIQLTFKANYADAAGWSGLDLVAHPELAAEYAGAAVIAAAFWVHKGLNAVAEGTDEDVAIEEETRRINGGTLGLPERIAAIRRAARIWA
jgi:putative chitinase